MYDVKTDASHVIGFRRLERGVSISKLIGFVRRMQPCKRIACHGRNDDAPLEFGVPYMCTNKLVAPGPFWRIDQNHFSNLGMLSQVSAGSMWACWERRCQISMLWLNRIALQHWEFKWHSPCWKDCPHQLLETVSTGTIHETDLGPWYS